MSKTFRTNHGKKGVNESHLQEKTTTIFEVYDELLESDRKSSRLAIRMGNHLIAAKKMVKREKSLWKTYCIKTLSDIPSHEIRDCMYIAARFSKDPLPCLSILNRTNLKKFFQFCKGESPKSVLSRNDIDPIDKDASEEDIKDFRRQVLKLLQAAGKKPAGSKLKEKRQLDQQPSDNGNISHTILYRDGLMRIMENTLKKPRTKIKPFKSETLTRFLKLQAMLKQYIDARAPRNEED